MLGVKLLTAKHNSHLKRKKDLTDSEPNMNAHEPAKQINVVPKACSNVGRAWCSLVCKLKVF